MFSLEVHPTKKLGLFGYAGTEYLQRTFYRNSAGVLVGYAPPTASNSGCFVDGVPTAGTGYAPGSGTCLGANRIITQGSVGYIYRLYSGPAGRFQYGLAYSYLTRTGWFGIGGAPTATNNFVYTSVQYYLPQLEFEILQARLAIGRQTLINVLPGLGPSWPVLLVAAQPCIHSGRMFNPSAEEPD